MVDLAKIEAERERIRGAFLREADKRSPTTARGVHHIALLSSNVERTVRFYQDVLGFPLTEIFENRDYKGSNHFFFDIGNGNLLAFFDFPDLGLGPYAEVLGGLHHIAISVERDQWEAAKERLEAIGASIHIESDTSMYFNDPDGARLELIADKLGEMYGNSVG
jgi:catechol 2,3-dioxygenase-like lactoylglutathione lyase family enzyme